MLSRMFQGAPRLKRWPVAQETKVSTTPPSVSWPKWKLALVLPAVRSSAAEAKGWPSRMMSSVTFWSVWPSLGLRKS
jgi:hypothetical protein